MLRGGLAVSQPAHFAKIAQKAMLPVVWCLGMAQMTLRYEYRQNFAELNFAVWSSSAKHAKIMLLENVASLVQY